ncbi:type II secretion system GspH family protein [Massilia agilis]|uniref:Type II secretion system GspH family protein n=1 Tax=Massilia agilis TaxID=1811226 RepID=A0ABT2DB49_9BURK|nr:type II secretion system protein [Massilia agilis]MCS0808511.1 type II secretion system GspH family protein [Massilia agilis]
MRRQHGFTYLGLIVLVTIIGMVGALTLKADALLRRAAAEEELLETGAAFSAALQSYAAATPRGQPTQPPTLQDLLRDPRFPNTRRHLRKIFVDPITGKAEWGIVYANGEKGVVAVYSLSKARPLKVANFDERFAGFAGKEHISDWKFTAAGLGVLQQGQPLEKIAVSSRDRPEDFTPPQEQRAPQPVAGPEPPRDDDGAGQPPRQNED